MCISDFVSIGKTNKERNFALNRFFLFALFRLIRNGYGESWTLKLFNWFEIR